MTATTEIKISKCTRNRLAWTLFAISMGIMAYTAFKWRSERQLRDALSAFMESDEYGRAIVDESGCVVDWNAAAEQITGWPKNEIARRGLEPLMDHDMWESHCLAFGEAMREGRHPEVVVVECRVVPKDPAKQPIPVRVTVRIAKSPLGNIYAIALIDRQRDIRQLSYYSETRNVVHE